MFSMRANVKLDFQKVTRAVHSGNVRSLGHAAAAIRLTARRSIRSRKKPSLPGSPPSTQTRRLPRSILYAVDPNAESAVIGPAHSLIGEAGSAHELGGAFRQEHYRKRPFMRPALLKLSGRLPSHWSNSIKE